MWKSLKTLVDIIAELPSENRLTAQAMPQTHYLNGERGFMNEVTLLLPRENKQPRHKAVENQADTLILAVPSLQNLR